MKFLTDENIAGSVVRNLRKCGFDVKDLKEENLQGIKDKEIINIAHKEDRIIITHDKDFEEIAFNTEHRGIILIRLRDQKPKNVARKLIDMLTLEIKEKFKNNINILRDDQLIIKNKETK